MKQEDLTISKQAPTGYDRNYAELRTKGLEYIEKLAGKIWTDYNIHDPGITMLELLCYAITDLGYRIDHPVEDLVAEPEKNQEAMHEKFFSAKTILTTCPVTEFDYRKIMIDLDGVRNAWMLNNNEISLHLDCKAKWEEGADTFGTLSYTPPPSDKEQKTFKLKGLYNILVDFDKEIQDIEDETERTEKKQEVIALVRETYHKNRNLCEDLIEVQEVPIEKVKLCIEIELEPNAKAEEVHADILYAVYQYFNPPVNFYSLEGMLDKTDGEGNPLTVDEVFETPVLNYGFIDDDELEASDLCREVRASDLIALIMELDGVKLVREFYMSRSAGDFFTDNEWILKFYGDSLPDLDMDLTVINYQKADIPIQLDEDSALLLFQSMVAELEAGLKSKTMEDMPMPMGRYRELAQYRSVQLDFPDNYGINEVGLPGSAPEPRKAQALQLKGYLLFFDQLLALYMKQLSQVKDLLHADDAIPKSYFAQAVHDIPDIDQLIPGKANRDSIVEALTADLDNYHERKNTLLDHLVARFAERFGEFSFLMRELFGGSAEDAIIRHKVKFLLDYPGISRCRAHAFDYYNTDVELWDTDNVSGLQKRVARLSGMRDYHRRNLSSVPFEIYQEEDSDTESEWRWRVFDDDKNILLSSSQHYHDRDEAYEEMWITILLGWSRQNYEVKLTEDEDQYFFNVIDETGEVVGRRIQFFDSPEETEAAIIDIMDYLYGKVAEDGMYVIEHILVRPAIEPTPEMQMFLPVCVDANCHTCGPIDPYSFRISVILPGWTQRLSNIDFRKFLDKLIRTETPSHILPRICFIGQEQMAEFEVCYKAWLEVLHTWQRLDETGRNDFFPTYRDTLQEFIRCLHKVHTIYPEGTLSDCSDTDANRIILNRTNLGTT
jgi:hypothetical protein